MDKKEDEQNEIDEITKAFSDLRFLNDSDEATLERIEELWRWMGDRRAEVREIPDTVEGRTWRWMRKWGEPDVQARTGADGIGKQLLAMCMRAAEDPGSLKERVRFDVDLKLHGGEGDKAPDAVFARRDGNGKVTVECKTVVRQYRRNERGGRKIKKPGFQIEMGRNRKIKDNDAYFCVLWKRGVLSETRFANLGQVINGIKRIVFLDVNDMAAKQEDNTFVINMKKVVLSGVTTATTNSGGKTSFTRLKCVCAVKPIKSDVERDAFARNVKTFASVGDAILMWAAAKL